MLPPDVKSIVVERDEGVQVSGCLEKGSYRFFFSVFFDSAYARVQLCIRSMATWPHCQKTQTEKEQTPPQLTQPDNHLGSSRTPGFPVILHPMDSKQDQALKNAFNSSLVNGMSLAQYVTKVLIYQRALTCQRFELLGCFFTCSVPRRRAGFIIR